MKSVAILLSVVVILNSFTAIFQIDSHKKKQVAERYGLTKETESIRMQTKESIKRLENEMTPDREPDSVCMFNTKGKEKSLDLDIDIFMQCKWKEKTVNEYEPLRVAEFEYLINKNEGIGLSIDIEPSFLDSFSTQDLKKYCSKEFKEMVADMLQQQYISSSSREINHILASEMVTYKSDKGYHYKYLYTSLYYKAKTITITYAFGSDKKQRVNDLFDMYKAVFVGLINRTIIH